MAVVVFGKSTALSFTASLERECSRMYTLGRLWLGFSCTPDQDHYIEGGRNDFQSHGGNGEERSFPGEGGNVFRIKGKAVAGQSKQSISDLVFLCLILEGYLALCTVKVLSFIDI